MRTRHRIPSIFNLSMVDVLCCALGCVILLWLLNLYDARQRAEAAGRTESELARTRTDLDAKAKEAASERDRLQAAVRRAESAEQERERLRGDLAAMRAARAEVEERLEQKTEEQQALARALTDVRQRRAALEKQMQAREEALEKAARAATDLAGRLRESEDRARDLQVEADRLPALREEAGRNRLRLQALEKEVEDQKRGMAGAGKQMGTLEANNERLRQDLAERAKEVAELNRRLTGLAEERKGLQARFQEDDKRFAGINLTGKRVVFLVDMSGSMELLDEKTPAPNKWNGVRQTLAKVMRSLPGLEQFQVILFSDRVSYPLGNIDRWINYDANSVDQTLKALALVKPQGNTNMYGAFEAAFRMRARGLDTIYLLSDGLPSVGEGLPDGRQFTDTERSDLLSKFIRRKLANEWNRPIDGRPPVRINAIGFFYESPDVGAFLWALAREHGGSFVGMSQP